MKSMLLIAAALSLLTASSVIFAAEEEGKSSSEMPPQMPPAEVSFVTTEAKDVPIRAEGLGFTESSLVSEVRARVTAFILERHFAEGNLVKQGDLLYTLESESFEADVQVVEASIASSEARLKLATLELDRLASLQQSDAVAQVDVDKAQAEADQARASLRLYKAELNKAKLSLSYTKVYAPITGLAGKTLFDTGALVEENDTLIEITRIDPIYITFGVSEKEYLQWKNDRTAGGAIRPTEGSNRFEIFVQDGSVLTGGTLNYEDPSFALATGTTRLRLSFPNPDGKLKPGQFVKVRAAGWSRPNSITVPQRSVLQTPNGAAVFVIGAGDVVEYRPVTLGGWVENDWIIASGLEPGERVLVEGFMKAPPGSPVTLVPYTPPADAFKAAQKKAE